MEQSFAWLPHQLRPEYGYHRECYQRFTMNLHHLQDGSDNQPSTSKLCRRSSTDNIFSHLTAYSATQSRGRKFSPMVPGQQKVCPYLSLMDGELYQDSYWRSTNTQECESQGDLQKAHHDMFTAITGIVDKDIFLTGKILKLSDLCNMYIALLQNTRYANTSYCSSKLKAKLENSMVTSYLFVILVDSILTSYTSAWTLRSDRHIYLRFTGEQNPYHSKCWWVDQNCRHTYRLCHFLLWGNKQHQEICTRAEVPIDS